MKRIFQSDDEGREARRVWHRDYYQKHKVRLNAAKKAWVKANRAAFNAQQRKYCKTEKHKQRASEYTKKRMEIPHNKIARSLRRRLRSALLGQGAAKSNGTIDLLGCSAAELMLHLQKQFKPGMSWNNYGLNGWHIDHIRPCSKFNLTDPDQQKRCFHYTNLQPLWAWENQSKGGKYSMNQITLDVTHPDLAPLAEKKVGHTCLLTSVKMKVLSNDGKTLVGEILEVELPDDYSDEESSDSGDSEGASDSSDGSEPQEKEPIAVIAIGAKKPKA